MQGTSSFQSKNNFEIDLGLVVDAREVSAMLHCPQEGSFAKGCEHSPGLLLTRDGRYWVIIPRPKGLTINYQFFVNFPMLPSFSDAYTHHEFKVFYCSSS